MANDYSKKISTKKNNQPTVSRTKLVLSQPAAVRVKTAPRQVAPPRKKSVALNNFNRQSIRAKGRRKKQSGSSRFSGGAGSLVFLLLIIIIIAVIAWGAYSFVGQRQSWLTNQPATDKNYDNYQIPLGIDVSQPASDPTADWLEFDYFAENSTLIPVATSTSTSTSTPTFTPALPLMSFKYPANLTLSSSTNNTLVTLSGLASSTEITVELVDYNQGLDNYLATLDKQAQTAWKGKKSMEVLGQSLVILDNISGLSRSEKLLATNLSRQAVYLPISSSTIAVFNLVGENPNEALQQFYNLFLSTVKISQ